MTTTLLKTLLSGCNDDRFRKEFDEINKIGKGGFSSVYKVRNKLDETIYAVKKIQLKIKDIKNHFDLELDRVLRETRILSKINHQNIIRYYNSWIELKYKKERKISEQREKRNTEPKEIQEKEEANDEYPYVFDENTNNFEDLGFELVIENEGCNSALEKERKRTKSSLSILGFLEEKKKSAKPESHLKKNGEEAKDEPVFLNKDAGLDFLENIKFINIFIQAEICQKTLEDYLNERNNSLIQLKNLKDFQERKERYYKEAIVILEQILFALNYIHYTCQLVHRDLKPSNIFLNKYLQTKIGDFGLVKKIEFLQPMFASPFVLSPRSSKDFSVHIMPNVPILKAELSNPSPEFVKLKAEKSDKKAQQKSPESAFPIDFTKQTRSCGTLAYASPEQTLDNNLFVDQRADIYSLGLIILQLFYPMTTQMEKTKTFDKCKEGSLPKELVLEFEELSAVIINMVNEEPELRPTLKDVAEAILKTGQKLRANTKFWGAVEFKLSNSEQWRESCFKIINKHIYFFSKESAKANTVYDLDECKLDLYEPSASPLTKASNEKSYPLEIILEHPFLQDIKIRSEDDSYTRNVYDYLKKLKSKSAMKE